MGNIAKGTLKVHKAREVLTDSSLGPAYSHRGCQLSTQWLELLPEGGLFQTPAAWKVLMKFVRCWLKSEPKHRIITNSFQIK